VNAVGSLDVSGKVRPSAGEGPERRAHVRLVRRAANVATVAWLSVCGAAFAADSGSSKSQALVGGWSGTWSGASTGHIDLTIAQAASGTFSGSISVTPDQGPAYATTLDDVSVEDVSLTAHFKTPDGNVSITLKGTLEGSTLDGTYEAKENQGGSNLDTGTWTASASKS
jgi:hypothetical protein